MSTMDYETLEHKPLVDCGEVARASGRGGGISAPTKPAYNACVLVLRYLVVFFAFAVGAVAARRAAPARSARLVSALELVVLIAALLAAALCYRGWQGALAVAAVSAAAMALGAASSRAAGRRLPALAGGTREFEFRPATTPHLNAWKKYLGFSREIADYEMRLVLLFAYYVTLAPIAAVANLARSHSEAEASWHERFEVESLDTARKPF